MKKILVLSICLFFAGYYAQSQNFGVKAGLNLSTLAGDTEGLKIKPGLHIGALAQFELSDMFKLQPELIFSQQGYAVEAIDDAKVNMSYLNIPIIAKFYLGGGGFNIQAGPQIGLLLAAKAKFPGIDDQDVKEQLESFDFGVAVGLGYDISNIVIDARFIPGFTNTSKAASDADVSDPNQNIQVSVGYTF